ncbi:Methyl-CpG-binding domain-containing protein 9 [Cardamine amara subsp. amara]|uniref:Methyl-CpG-binding domain-containing protein 9 n=1 Tax=Cardamine amara subsp. amara TaxID=228776 RepID=A0ABD1AYH1_CARAN
MGKRNTFWARNSNRKVRSKDKGSDDSDEDYVISDEDEEESEADLKEYASSVDGEPSFDGFDVSDGVEDEELNEVEEEDVMLRNVDWPKVKTGPRGSRKITGCKSRKMNQVVSDNEDVDLDDADYEEDEIRNSMKVVGRSNVDVGSLDGEKHQRIGLGKRRRVFYEIEDEDGDYPEEDGEEEEERDVENVGCEQVDLNSLHDGEDGEMTLEEQDNVSHETEKEDDGDYEGEDDDEEFTADEDVSLDEEEEEEAIACNKKSLKVCKKNKRKRRSGERRKRRKKCSVAKTPLTKGRKRRGRKSKKGVDDDGDFVDDCLPARKKAKTKLSRSRHRCTVPSDSDIASSGESDYEYTISEEEREQVRETDSLLRSSVKHASSIRKTTVKKDWPQLRKSPVKKGGKKVELLKINVTRNVCGICLSEEDMRRLKGTLDCCSHYFCFTCIMEWSKVESRCPLCKQRFRTISKPARSTPGVDLREVVIPVPERDQVYQPTEEELRSYLDPYENTICTECHQGEDDGLMLLCDLCDSSAHTYCVGLGREVPEGNWYCEGCRPVSLGSASSQTHTTSEQQRVSGFYSRPSPLVVSGQYQDVSLLVSPRTPFFNGENLFSPRLLNGDAQGSSPSGIGATTLSRRRTLHRHIQNIINGDRLSNMGSRTGGTSIGNSSDGFVTTQIGHGRTIYPSQPVAPEETGVSLYTTSEERRPNNNSLISAHDPGLLSPKLDNNTFLGERPVDLGLRHGVAQGDPLFCNQQHVPSYMPNTMSSRAGEQLQQRVIAHLKNLSSQIDLGQATFDEISMCSIHTILAACGLEHKSSEVHLVPPPVTCPHDNMTPGSSSSSSLMKGCCYSCFDSFVEDVVKMILDTRQPHWLRLGLH